jgi:hypothetical protein
MMLRVSILGTGRRGLNPFINITDFGVVPVEQGNDSILPTSVSLVILK